jgi:hypothetical protein
VYIQQLFDKRYWELVFNHIEVESAIVDAHAPRFVLFLDKQCCRREGVPNDPLTQHLRALAFKLIFLNMGISVRLNRA